MAPSNCDEFRENIHPLLDGELTPYEQTKLLEHMAECESCREEYEQLSAVRDMLAHMDDELETPLEFEQGWRNAVRQESRQRRSRRWMKALSCAAAGFVMLAGATAVNRYAGILPQPTTPAIESPAPVTGGDGAAVAAISAGDEPSATAYSPDATAVAQLTSIAQDDADVDIQAQFDYSSDDDLGATSSGGLLDVDEEQSSSTSGTMKVLRSASLDIETENFDEDMTLIKSTVAKFGGLFERSSIAGDAGGRSAELILRVPAGFLETFVDQMRDIGHVTRSEVSAQDITSQYTDTALRLDTYRTQLNRVKELTADAADLNAVLALEAEASRLQYEIDKLTGSLKGWDSQAEMSTVTVILSEYTQVNAAFSSGFGQQLSGQFYTSMNRIGGFFGDMMLTATALLPHLVWLAPLAALALLVTKLIKKNGHGRRRHAS